MHYDFLEIGTCDFEAMILDADENTRGISVEAMDIYLDRLPDRENVRKINAAIVPSSYGKKTVEIFFVHPDTIKEHDLAPWLAGCNSVGEPHQIHTRYFGDATKWHYFKATGQIDQINTVNLLERGWVSKRTIPCLSFQDLVKQCHLDTIHTVKIDIEGLDSLIVYDILSHYGNQQEKAPTIIEFEANTHSPAEEVELAIIALRIMNYDVLKSIDPHTNQTNGIIAHRKP
jgi:hypothetical protein